MFLSVENLVFWILADSLATLLLSETLFMFLFDKNVVAVSVERRLWDSFVLAIEDGRDFNTEDVCMWYFGCIVFMLRSSMATSRKLLGRYNSYLDYV